METLPPKGHWRERIALFSPRFWQCQSVTLLKTRNNPVKWPDFQLLTTWNGLRLPARISYLMGQARDLPAISIQYFTHFRAC
jgi:hypothetical protein